jgi:uncharacterized protein
VNELHLAAYNGDQETVLRLLAEGASVDGRDQSGYTPLLWACFRAGVTDQALVVNALIKAGADANAVTEAGDSNCLMLAVQAGSAPVVRALVTGGARLDETADGVTALMVAARAGDNHVAELLLELGASAEVQCGSFTACDYARHGGHEALAARLEPATVQRRRLTGRSNGPA